MTIELRGGKTPEELLSAAEKALRESSEYHSRKAATQRASHPVETDSSYSPALANEALAGVHGRYAGKLQI